VEVAAPCCCAAVLQLLPSSLPRHASLPRAADTDLSDIKRVIVNTHAIEPQALVEYFGTLSGEPRLGRWFTSDGRMHAGRLSAFDICLLVSDAMFAPMGC